MSYPGYAHRQHFLLFPGKQQLVTAAPYQQRSHGVKTVCGHRTPIYELPKGMPLTTRRKEDASLFRSGTIEKTKYGTNKIPFQGGGRGVYMLDYGKLRDAPHVPPTRKIDRVHQFDRRTTNRAFFVDPSACEPSDDGDVLPRITVTARNAYDAKMTFAEITQQNADVVQIQTHGTTKDVVSMIMAKVPESITSLTKDPLIQIRARKAYNMSWYPPRTRETFCDHQRMASGDRQTMLRTGIKSLH